MAGVDRHAVAEWEGDLTGGAGKFTGGSGALGENEVTWASRTSRSEGKTSPEELVAAAHATCFAMSMTHEIKQAGGEPEALKVKSTVRIEMLEDGPKVTTAHLEASGRAGGVDQDGFEKAAAAAAEGCPISKALAGVEITHEAKLES